MSNRAAVDAVVTFFEDLCLAPVARYGDYCADAAYFKDPFNEVCGLAPIQRIFAHRFRQVDEPCFVVRERVVADNGALLAGERHDRLRGSRKTASPQVIRGALHLRFDSAGKVGWHRDYWDAAEELYASLRESAG